MDDDDDDLCSEIKEEDNMEHSRLSQCDRTQTDSEVEKKQTVQTQTTLQ